MPHNFAIGVAVLFIEEILKRPVDKKSNFVHHQHANRTVTRRIISVSVYILVSLIRPLDGKVGKGVSPLDAHVSERAE
jgi:hypothetical protein